MQLHDHAAFPVFSRKEVQQMGGQLFLLAGRQLLRGAVAFPLKQIGSVVLPAVRNRQKIHSVVGDHTAVCAEPIQPPDKPLPDLGKRPKPSHSGRSAQCVQRRRVTAQHPVGAEGRGNRSVSVHPVCLQRIGRVVGGGDVFHTEAAQKIRNTHGFQLFVRRRPDFIRRFRRERLHDAEQQLQLHLRPVVERIAAQAREDFRIFAVFLIIGRVPRDEMLVHAAQAHGTPFVMVAAEPERAEVCKADVVPDLVFVQVAVIIDNRQIPHRRVQALRRRRAEQQTVSEKFLHRVSSVGFIVQFFFADAYMARISRITFAPSCASIGKRVPSERCR